MPVSFIGSETSSLKTVSATEVTTANTFRTPQSRSAVNLQGSQTAYAEWDSAVAEGWLRYQGQGSADNDGSDLILVVTTSASGNLFRLVTSNPAVMQPQCWVGGAWVNSGSAISMNTAIIEWVVHLVAGASGSWLLFANGSPIAGEDAAFDGTDMLRVTFCSPDDGAGTLQRVSEVILGDADFGLVNSSVETEPPTADGTDTSGTGTYVDVDEAIFDDADSIALAAAGNRHSFTSAARTSTQDTILGVSVGARMKCDVTGPQGAKFYLKIGGTRYYGSDMTLTNAFTGYSYTWAENPATTDPWTPTDANAATLEWGIEAIA
jgi:hypothetical protein